MLWSLGAGLALLPTVYAAGQRSYFQFAAAFDFPASRLPSGISCFLQPGFLHQGLAPSSITTYIAAVRSLHIDLGAVDPTRGGGGISARALVTRYSPRSCFSSSAPSPYHQQCDESTLYRAVVSLLRSCHVLGCLLHGLFWFSTRQRTHLSGSLYPIPSSGLRGPTVRFFLSFPVTLEVLKDRSLW